MSLRRARLFSTGDEDPAAWGLKTENRYYFPGKENNDVYGCAKIPNDWILDAVEDLWLRLRNRIAARVYDHARCGLCRADQQAGILDLPQRRPGGYRGLERKCREDRLRICTRHARLQGAQSTDPSGIDAEASIRNGARILYLDTNNSSNDISGQKPV